MDLDREIHLGQEMLCDLSVKSPPGESLQGAYWVVQHGLRGPAKSAEVCFFYGPSLQGRNKVTHPAVKDLENFGNRPNEQ